MREFTEAEQAEFRRLEKEMLAEKAKQRAELAALRYEHEPKHPGFLCANNSCRTAF